ncbi:MAG TPA: type II secretion system protein [Thermoanaerobaculia bacterium]|nr:type II secretion system protein [Thermoanaerobaculia bacterium]
MVKTSRPRQSGFTLIELIVVVTIIGILASVAIANVKYAQRKAREAALKHDLFEMRKAIDDFYADNQRYPADLNELVPKYLRKIPRDPITDSEEWEQVPATDTALPGDVPETEDTSLSGPGIMDVRSRAEGTTLDGTPYNQL